MKTLKKCLITFVTGIVLGVILMVIAWMIPDEKLVNNVNDAVDLIIQEGIGWPFIFSYTAGAQLDNNTDCIMIQNALAMEENTGILQNAMSVHGYNRYWHGYLVFLRPMLSFLKYTDIRYIYMFLLMFLLGANLMLMREKMGRDVAYIFLAVMCLGNFVIIPFSLQFSSVFIIMLIANLVLLKNKKIVCDNSNVIAFFLAIGMITNYADFLTAPIITLGIPLVVYSSLKEQNKKFKDVIWCSFSWGMGYFMTWIMKWLLTTLVIHENVFTDALSQAQKRMNGATEEEVSLINAIMNNVKTLMPHFLGNVPHLMIVIAIIVIVFTAVFIIRGNKQKLMENGVLLLIALYPIAWYGVMREHSQLHFIFTYRSLLVSVFAGLMWLRSAKKEIQS